MAIFEFKGEDDAINMNRTTNVTFLILFKSLLINPYNQVALNPNPPIKPKAAKKKVNVDVRVCTIIAKLIEIC